MLHSKISPVCAKTHTKHTHTHILWAECTIFRVLNTVVQQVLATHYRVKLYRLTALRNELLHESLNRWLWKQRHTSSNRRLGLMYIYLQRNTPSSEREVVYKKHNTLYFFTQCLRKASKINTVCTYIYPLVYNIWYIISYIISYDILNCNWVDIRWQ
jgi:hypothetical protein